ncbi:DUF930 domain-containing protein [Rhizobium redzepovicii]|uniref:DUF930 domain-containing protein n=1 Tax=Rhizobium redzepovicii TaxID=2867518 RepID=UPI0028715EBC|nr:DUF930 domain-containing protein [Rhizobium redzepovicii]MDR9781873.1 DUF930 domain-containing protein [Rhizobium redzepovicii]
MWLDAAGFKGHIAAVTEEDVAPAETQHETGKQRPEIRWGIGASVLLHIPLLALLIFGLPKIEPKPAEEESVKVELVPPPEEKKPEPEPEEKPPEPKPPEQAKKQPPPPPPPPPPRPAENKPSEQAKPAAPMPSLNPVFEFGDRNSGPKKSMAGNSSQGEVKPATTAPQHGAKPEQAPAEASAEKPPTDMPPARPVPDDVQLPEVVTADVSPERNAPLAEAAPGEANTDIEVLNPPERKPPEPTKMDAAKDDLVKAKTLFSQGADDDPVAKIAMNGVPRGKRVAQLCSNELQQQLIHASPSFQPIIVPSQSLSRGTVLDLRAAFRTAEGWYDVHFRCEVDEDATKVVSFAFDVSGAIPRSQWKGRGLPVN